MGQPRTARPCQGEMRLIDCRPFCEITAVRFMSTTAMSASAPGAITPFGP